MPRHGSPRTGSSPISNRSRLLPVLSCSALRRSRAATTASADPCPVTPPITRRRAPRPRCASLPRSLAKGWQPPPAPGPCSTSRPFWFVAHRRLGARAEQISPNKNMRFRCTTAAFTLSAELSGFVVWCQLARRLSLRCGSCSSARNFALGLPSDKPSRSCPCPRLVVILIASSPPTADFHRISSCPCRAYTSGCSRQSPAAFVRWLLRLNHDVRRRMRCGIRTPPGYAVPEASSKLIQAAIGARLIAKHVLGWCCSPNETPNWPPARVTARHEHGRIQPQAF